MSLSLGMKKGESATLVDTEGAYLGTVRVAHVYKSEVKLQFDMPDHVEIARDALLCDCDEHEFKHPIWWCNPQYCQG